MLMMLPTTRQGKPSSCKPHLACSIHNKANDDLESLSQLCMWGLDVYAEELSVIARLRVLWATCASRQPPAN